MLRDPKFWLTDPNFFDLSVLVRADKTIIGHASVFPSSGNLCLVSPGVLCLCRWSSMATVSWGGRKTRSTFGYSASSVDVCWRRKQTWRGENYTVDMFSLGVVYAPKFCSIYVFWEGRSFYLEVRPQVGDRRSTEWLSPNPLLIVQKLVQIVTSY